MAKKSAKSKGYRKQVGKKPYLSKRDIVMLCVLVAVLSVAAYLLFSYDDGALKVKDGKITDAGENWLIVNGSPTAGRYRYYKVGEIGELEGFDRENSPLSDGNVPRYVFKPQDESSAVTSISATTSHSGAERLAKYVVSSMSGLSNSTFSGISTAETDGAKYTWFTILTVPEETAEAQDAEAGGTEEAKAEATEAPEAETAGAEEPAEAAEGEAAEAEAADAKAEAPKYTISMNAYLDCSHDSCIVVDVNASAEEKEALPDEDALKALAEQALAAVTLEEAK